MQALSIQQPWAWLIVEGIKDIENRNWPTAFRGPFLVHAGKRFDKAAYEWLRMQPMFSDDRIRLPLPTEYRRGGIIGKVDLVGCVTAHDSLWFHGRYGFVLKNPATLPFLEFPGKLGWFSVPMNEQWEEWFQFTWEEADGQQQGMADGSAGP